MLMYCMFVSVWEMLRHGGSLYRLATPVHRGQSTSNKKCVYKWGSYFYCFYHFTGSIISLVHSHFLPHSPFLGRPFTFPPPPLPPALFAKPWKCRSLVSEVLSSLLLHLLLLLLLLVQVSRASGIHQGFFCPGFPASDTVSSGQLLAPTLCKKKKLA